MKRFSSHSFVASKNNFEKVPMIFQCLFRKEKLVDNYFALASNKNIAIHFV